MWLFSADVFQFSNQVLSGVVESSKITFYFYASGCCTFLNAAKYHFAFTPKF